MPAFYPSQMPRQLLTPPESMPYPSDAYLASSQQFYRGGNDSSYELEGDKYYYAKHQYYSQVPSRDMYPDHGHPQVPSYSSRQSNVYGNIGAPVLPPIRIPDNMDLSQHRHADRQSALQEHPKEEKVAGGVAAHLDYEMEQMVDFVAETAQAIVQGGSAVSPSFRKYVSQILTSTRLPSSTIVLALHYLSTRMTMLSSQGVYTSSSGHLYHMLTTALMLASKFLDDNTFQNRSWAEVSHISVADLNKHELDWLLDIGWKLHIDAEESSGFSIWLRQWKTYQAKKVAMSMEALKITPVDTTLRLQQPPARYMPPTPTYTPTYSEAAYNIKDRASPHWPHWTQARTLSPPSANHSSPNTPNWYDSHSASTGYNQVPSLWHGGQLPRLPNPVSSNSPFYHNYGQQYAANWAHGSNCGCGYCSAHNDRYLMGNSYGMQTVVG